MPDTASPDMIRDRYDDKAPRLLNYLCIAEARGGSRFQMTLFSKGLHHQEQQPAHFEIRFQWVKKYSPNGITITEKLYGHRPWLP